MPEIGLGVEIENVWELQILRWEYFPPRCVVNLGAEEDHH